METLIQQTHAASAQVTAAYGAAVLTEGLSPLTGHQFVSQMSHVTMHLADALGHSADGHRLLRRLGASLGYDVTAYGDTACPDDLVSPTAATQRDVA